MGNTRQQQASIALLHIKLVQYVDSTRTSFLYVLSGTVTRWSHWHGCQTLHILAAVKRHLLGRGREEEGTYTISELRLPWY